ncbi:MAG TPA: hypothetical protein VJL87_07020, partial [Bdellovibrionota bacterium]|nr:hypothetical protein [Bdellovibrionota bacterium]
GVENSIYALLEKHWEALSRGGHTDQIGPSLPSPYLSCSTDSKYQNPLIDLVSEGLRCPTIKTMGREVIEDLLEEMGTVVRFWAREEEIVEFSLAEEDYQKSLGEYLKSQFPPPDIGNINQYLGVEAFTLPRLLKSETTYPPFPSGPEGEPLNYKKMFSTWDFIDEKETYESSLLEEYKYWLDWLYTGRLSSTLSQNTYDEMLRGSPRSDRHFYSTMKQIIQNWMHRRVANRIVGLREEAFSRMWQGDHGIDFILLSDFIGEQNPIQGRQTPWEIIGGNHLNEITTTFFDWGLDVDPEGKWKEYWPDTLKTYLANGLDAKWEKDPQGEWVLQIPDWIINLSAKREEISAAQKELKEKKKEKK